jgi:hypothetical protein
MSKKNLTLPYFLVLILLLVGGLMWVFLKYQPNILRMASLLIAVLVCAIINLTYFLSYFNFWMRLLLPGITCVIIFWFLTYESKVERIFFTFFGVFNFSLGLSWFLAINFKLKSQK